MRDKLKRKMTPCLLIVSLASLSACVATPSSDFCLVVSGPILFPAQVAQVVVRDARAEAVKIDTQNRYGAARCGW